MPGEFIQNVTKPIFNFYSINIIFLPSECREYEDAVYETVRPINGKPERVKRCNNFSNFLIISGNIALPAEFPHMVHSFIEKQIESKFFFLPKIK